ncbi:MAG: T9SS type A sorting domain-containing protein [Ignavibacteria bacterium]|jgi:hypothetical protein|nr:T9SS type A sorting domain-containing protein [Ignavibacteria bacterium]
MLNIIQNKRNTSLLRFLIILALVCTNAIVLFGQNYEFTLYPRRAYDQLHIEVWARANNANVAKLGNASLVMQYNTAYLTPSLQQNLTQTDSLLTVEANATYPVITINSDFSAGNGYAAVSSSSYSAGYYSLEINHDQLGIGGLNLGTTGRGSFLGIVSFDIIGNPAPNALANFAWSKSAFPGDVRIFDINGNDIKTQVTLTDPAAGYTVTGVSILSPNRDRMVIDRDATYKFLEKDYVAGGYPIYFERSINPTDYRIIAPPAIKSIDENLAYVIEYSLDNGNAWTEVGRVSETDKTSNAASGNYRSGEIYATSGTTYYITSQTGTQVNSSNFRKPLRIIWSKDQYFFPRSEQAKLRITILNGDITQPIGNRTASDMTNTNQGQLIIGRLFFTQLNGTNQYLKTNGTYSNATQLTVSAWVNLNGYQAAGNNPAIVASSGGPLSAPLVPGFASNEGAWMLYLRDGRIPAFRAREIQARGDAATPIYLAQLEAYPLDSLIAVANTPLTDAHSHNWVNIAATVKDNVVCLYINGELVSSATNSNFNDCRMIVTDHPIWIGINPNTAITAGSFLNAGIKGVQIWRNALTQDQIRIYAAGIPMPDSISSSVDDVRKTLEMYYSLEGTTADLASNTTYQKGRQDISFYNDGGAGQLVNSTYKGNDDKEIDNDGNDFAQFKFKPSNSLQASTPVDPTYRPDQPHLQISSPAKGAGIGNKAGDQAEIRWVSYGMTDLAKASKLNYEIDYTMDGGQTWTPAKNHNGQNLVGTTIPSPDIGYAVWEPYQNNSAAANLRSLTPYAKTVQLRLQGFDGSGNVAFTSTSDTFAVAPYFAIRSIEGSQLRVDARMGMNIVSDYAYIEAWLKPYRFPLAGEGFFPIAEKSQGGVLHYAFRLMMDGSLTLIVTDINGVVYTARTSSSLVLVAPNSVNNDSLWTHVAVLFIRNNDNNISEARFYVDGNYQYGANLAQQFNASIALNTDNPYPLYIGSNPAVTANSFVGEMKEVRFWNGLPNNASPYGAEPTEMTKFVQKSQAEDTKTLTEANKTNLHSAFSMDGGTFFANGGNRVAALWATKGITLNNYGVAVKFVPFQPFIKLVEPQFKQSIANTDKAVKVRWVGQYYDGLNFVAGANKVPPSLRYSILGGGGNEVQPYQYVGGNYFSGNKTNSIKLLTTDEYQSNLSATKKYFALALDASMANPDVNKDGAYGDQGPLSPTLTNGRLELSGTYSINGETFPLVTEGPLFTINPPNNFTIRIMLEGYHQGSVAGKAVNQLGPNYDQGGLVLRLFTDNSGEISSKVGVDAFSANGFTDRDPVNLNKGNYRFANVDFLYTSIPNGSYWVFVDHINHLPIMSRYPAPFQFTGDVGTTWAIESGWDFLSWNGVDDNVMTSPSTTDIWKNNYYTAKGTAVNTAKTYPERYATTGLIYNGGTTDRNGLAAMVGGDVNQDGMINAADRVKVRQEEGLQSYQSDITGDKYVNAVDRTITDRNAGKVSSLLNTVIPASAPLSLIDPFNVIVDDNAELSLYLNKLAKVSGYKANDNPKDIDIEQRLHSKQNDALQAGLMYYVSAKTKYNDSGFVDVSVYIRNAGVAFAPANCTFPISFDTNAVTFSKFYGGDSVIFNSDFDYSKLDTNNIPENGYLKLSSAPKVGAANAYRNYKTIEIDYDAYSNLGGINVPSYDTYLGTLRFNVKKGAGIVAFHWHESRAVITTKGEDGTSDGIWDTIPAVLLYNATITQPNGGEDYQILTQQQVKWTTTGTADIHIYLSINNGITWMKLTDTAISSQQLQYTWTTPNVNSEQCLIRIVDAETNTEVDRSDGTFTISPPWGHIIQPYASSEPYKGGTVTQIEWTAGGTSCVRFEYSIDGGYTWTKISGNFGASATSTIKANWTLPKVTTKEAYVRMIDCNTDNILDVSGKFMIGYGTITFTQPAQNQTLQGCKTATIRWTTIGVTEFDLQLSTDGINWITIEYGVDASLKLYSWQILDAESNTCYFRAIYNGDEVFEFGRSKMFKIRRCTGIYDEPENGAIGNIFPNPTNGMAYITFDLPKPERLNIQVIDLTGNVVKEIANYLFGIGKQTMEFDISAVANGKYYVIITSDDFAVLRELNVVK